MQHYSNPRKYPNNNDNNNNNKQDAFDDSLAELDDLPATLDELSLEALQATLYYITIIL